MLNNISNGDILQNNTITQQAKIAGVNKNAASQNPYLKAADTGDVVDISDKAKQLSDKDKEIQKYKSMVMDSLNTPDESDKINSILDSIKSGGYISNDAIAEKMLKGDITLNNSQLISILYSNTNTSNASSFSDLLPKS